MLQVFPAYNIPTYSSLTLLSPGTSTERVSHWRASPEMNFDAAITLGTAFERVGG